MTTWHLAARCSIVISVLCCAACATTYGHRLTHQQITAIVESETSHLDLEVRPDFIDWSIRTIEATPAPDSEHPETDLSHGYHRFVRGIIEFAKGERETFLSAAIARLFLRKAARCGMIPCNTKKCCDFCRRPC